MALATEPPWGTAAATDLSCSDRTTKGTPADTPVGPVIAQSLAVVSEWRSEILTQESDFLASLRKNVGPA